jgi:hypothetical protein
LKHLTIWDIDGHPTIVILPSLPLCELTNGRSPCMQSSLCALQFFRFPFSKRIKKFHWLSLKWACGDSFDDWWLMKVSTVKNYGGS